ncbi:MAG: Chromosomal replication initiator protein DnaA [Microgenomates group bacterium GW2011_GWF2_45_18]|nr:MAG: Chromosomal replication initiator protein DnaA [Microgenomates group bacterium GW2011_GWF1_44_10]KKU01877.1 MAG: Chromosomal replication initiator protein DnaA [Microgenomates group bacterium GW2011_GWF2_45_18]OGJ40670.1 MAG: chromosomal replication initiator protein DnaA [Candidatus Pacebacteria bacterium RIFOXYB1_FULL_44_10]HAU98806.1 chromosomal replication initiator protein DnaA [Candidatus Paceibacterota bacterium]HAX01374.1 chromosomal replication initiator protein DnaA [Candidatu
MTAEDLWKRIRDSLEVTLSQGYFSMWIKPIQAISLHESPEKTLLTISSSSSYHLKMAEQRFSAQILEAGKQILPTLSDIRFSFEHVGQNNMLQKNLESDAPTREHGRPTEQSAPLFSSTESSYSSAIRRAGLREDYIFETFAVSTSNEMAHAAAIAVSQNPGKAYNPLFLYGGVGVGKTHLMQAVGHNILKKDPNASIAYITGEQFTNEIVAGIQQKKMIQLKSRLRNYSVLLVDDIQFIAGKEAVQEEFFHTFNAIAPLGGQIILTSDRAPQEIHPLEDRLKSRFEAGLIIDIQQPTFELRTAILLIKAKKLQLNLPMDCAQKIASVIESTRKLEGALAKLHSEHMLFKKPITLSLIEEIVGTSQSVSYSKQKVHPQDVIRAVAEQFHITTKSLKGPARSKELVRARHIAMFLLREESEITLQDIGEMFNGRDHTSVMHAVEKVKTQITQDEVMKTQVNAAISTISFASSTFQG